MSKPFSRKLYDDNDDAKHLILEHLAAHDFNAWINPDQYGIDIIFHDETFVYQYCEVEVKHNWKGENFPYETVHFPKRKIKFANSDSMFAMLNHDRTHVLWISGQQFLDAPIVKKNTIYTRDEEFIEIKIADCRIEPLKKVEKV